MTTPKKTFRDLQKHFLSRPELIIEHYRQYKSNISNTLNNNIFITLNDLPEKEFLSETLLRYKNETIRQLEGMIVSVKDNINVRGMKMTCASALLSEHQSLYDAQIIEALKNAGALIIGKTNLDEFAMGSSNETSYFGPTSNPLDSSLVPGGSSGGAAASVAAGTCDIAIGSDTGGSVRQPAAFCAVTGFKPGYGKLSRYGLTAFASSLDTIGIIGKTIDDISLAYDVMKDTNFKDRTARTEADIQIGQKPVIGYIDINKYEFVSKEVKNDYINVIQHLKVKNYKLERIELPFEKYLLPVYYIISSAEASSNLARYDGIRIKNSNGQPVDIESFRSANFGEEVKRRILNGVYILSEGYYDRYFSKAEYIRQKFTCEMEKLFLNTDYLILPTTPTLPFKIASVKDPKEMYRSDYFTVPASLAGLPAISIPCYNSGNNIPASIQIISSKNTEYSLLDFACKLKN